MRAPRIIPAFVAILFTALFAFADKVRVDYDRHVNFSKFRTFMWLEKPQTANPLMDDRLVQAVERQLLIRGLKPASRGADLGVRVSSSTEQIPIVNTYYSGWGWGWGYGGPGWATTYVDTYLQATTAVDLV